MKKKKSSLSENAKEVLKILNRYDIVCKHGEPVPIPDGKILASLRTRIIQYEARLETDFFQDEVAQRLLRRINNLTLYPSCYIARREDWILYVLQYREKIENSLRYYLQQETDARDIYLEILRARAEMEIADLKSIGKDLPETPENNETLARARGIIAIELSGKGILYKYLQHANRQTREKREDSHPGDQLEVEGL